MKRVCPEGRQYCRTITADGEVLSCSRFNGRLPDGSVDCEPSKLTAELVVTFQGDARYTKQALHYLFYKLFEDGTIITRLEEQGANGIMEMDLFIDGEPMALHEDND